MIAAPFLTNETMMIIFDFMGPPPRVPDVDMMLADPASDVSNDGMTLSCGM